VDHGSGSAAEKRLGGGRALSSGDTDEVRTAFGGHVGDRRRWIGARFREANGDGVRRVGVERVSPNDDPLGTTEIVQGRTRGEGAVRARSRRLRTTLVGYVCPWRRPVVKPDDGRLCDRSVSGENGSGRRSWSPRSLWCSATVGRPFATRGVSPGAKRRG